MVFLITLPIISGSEELIILFFIAIFLFVVSLILLVLEKGLKKKIKELSLNKTFFYTRQVKEIKKYSTELDTKQLLALINTISKSFFKDYLGLQRETTYEELAEEFEKIDDKNKANICRTLSELVYSKYDVEKESVVDILDELERIITEEGVLSEQTKKTKESDKRNVKKIKILFKEGIKSIKKDDTRKAEEIYAEIVKLYKRLSSKSKVKLQPKLIDLYKKIVYV